MNPTFPTSRLLVAAALTCAALGAQASTVVRDSQTGQLRPATAAEAQALAKQAASERGADKRAPRGVLSGTPNPQAVVRSDGSLEIEHDDSMLNHSVVTRGADGQVMNHCFTDASMARRAARGELVTFAKNMRERANDR